MKISEIIAKLEAYHGPLESDRERTCDTVQFGNPDQECTGIVLTCCPTAAVIQKAADLGYNFILGHEPLFYDGWDETDWLEENKVYHAKRKLLEKTGIVVYRDHDHMHNHKPDGIFSGLAKRLGWETYAQSERYFPGSVYALPETTVREVAVHVADVMHIDGIRILGDPDMPVKKVAIVGHFFGTEWDRLNIKLIEAADCDLIIPGEVIDWTLGEYIQDANTLGMKKAVLNVGHFNLEEPGMEHMADWLPGVIGEAVPIKFVQSGNSFGWLDFQKNT